MFISIGVSTVLAQNYPTRPIRLVLPVSAGGGADVIARTVGGRISATLGQAVVIDNRGGAGGNIAAEIVARSTPDGYTLGMALSSHTINPSLYKKLNYDAIRDFAPITLLATSPFVLVVHPSLPVNNVKEFVALSKATKDGLTYGSSGTGLLAHLAMELLKTMGGFKATHVPYKGTGAAMSDTVAGHVAANFPTMISGLNTIRAGRLRALGVTSLQRSQLLPNVPTVAEQGFPGYEVNGWYGLLAPAGTPREIITLLNSEAVKAVNQPDVHERLSRGGAVPVGNTPEAFATYIKSEMFKWAKVVKYSGATAQ